LRSAPVRAGGGAFLVAHQILGFADVQHAIADKLSEITIGYPKSPINAGSARGLEGPAPGRRIMGDRPFGEGDQPRFALMAADDAAARDLIKSHPTLVEGNLRSPPDKAAVWLVRPDGYAGAAAHASDWKPIRDCLARLTFASVGRILGCGREDVPGASPRFSASANSLPGLEIGLSAIGRVAIAILTHVAKPLVLGANIGGPT